MFEGANTTRKWLTRSFVWVTVPAVAVVVFSTLRWSCAEDGPISPTSSLPAIKLVASQWQEGFEEGWPAWSVESEESSIPIRFLQTANRELAHEGTTAAEIRFASHQQGRIVRLAHPLPPSQILDDLNCSLWMRATRNGARLGLRIRFVGQTDPETGQPLTALIYGETYQEAPDWQQVQCQSPVSRVREQVHLLRARYSPLAIDDRRVVVDQVVVEMQLPAEESVILLDDVHFGPVFSPAGQTQVVDFEQPVTTQPSAEFRLDQLVIGGHPAFPRIVPYHGESPEELRECGFNVVWIPDWRDNRLIHALRDQGLWVIATPPRPVSESGEFLEQTDASLVPFQEDTAAILAWYFGTRVPEESSDELIEWVDQVRSADRRFQRPVLADVSGAERVLSRHLSMTGISRHPINTSFSIRQYRDWLSRKRKVARPGSFVWTWIQTEPASANQKWRQAAQRRPIVVDYEQIRLQVYAALAAGYRAVGFWTRTPLDSSTPAGLERKLALQQLNLELRLLEPWLSTGTLVDRISCQCPHDPTVSQEVEAAVLRSGGTYLLLPIRYEPDAQFVAGGLRARDVRILVPGVPDPSFVWAVSTTKVISLQSERVAGGISFVLPEFDQTAAILISSNYETGRALRAKLETLQDESARVLIELAKVRLAQSEEVNAELNELEAGHSHAPQLLIQARNLTQRANDIYERSQRHQWHGQSVSQAAVRLFQQQDYDDARQKCEEAMQALRVLQRAHWRNAVRHLSSPMATQHTTCFHTLPDYWRMVGKIGSESTQNEGNLLPSGNFDDLDAGELLEEGWEHEQASIEGVRATAELALTSRRGNYCLRLAAGPETNADPPELLSAAPVQIRTPRVAVRRGQLVHVSVLIRVTSPLVASPDGFELFDNLTGRVGALRWNGPQTWQRFELIREVAADSEFFLTGTLNCLGEVQIDDLRIVALTPADVEPQSPIEARPDRKSRPGALDFLQRFPRLTPRRVK